MGRGELNATKSLDEQERVLMRGRTEVCFRERSGPIELEVNASAFDPERTSLGGIQFSPEPFQLGERSGDLRFWR